MSYAEEFDSELDSDPDDAKKKSKANMAVALMESTADLDDEVERVLGHRYCFLPTGRLALVLCYIRCNAAQYGRNVVYATGGGQIPC